MALSDVNEVIDLYNGTLSTTAAVALANRRDSNLIANSGGGIKRRLVGLVGRCGATGHLVVLLDQRPIFTCDLATLNGLTVPVEIVAEIPDGQQLSVSAVSTSGTNACAVALLLHREG